MPGRLKALADLHPATWWVFSASLAVAALSSQSVLFVTALTGLGLSLLSVLASGKHRAQAVRLYALLAGSAVVVRIAFGALFGSAAALNADSGEDQPAFRLPDVYLTLGFSQSVHILGATTWPQLHAYLLLGLRLASVISVVGLANTLANPRALLKATPAALYPVAAALGMALNIGPQLVASAARVRQAQRLRAAAKGRQTAKRILIPVLQDALDRSLALAANLESRGFGSGVNLSGAPLGAARLLLSLSLCLMLAASYLIASGQWLPGLACLLVALACAAVIFRRSAQANRRTRYLSHQRGWRDWLVVGAGVALALSGLLDWWPL